MMPKMGLAVRMFLGLTVTTVLLGLALTAWYVRSVRSIASSEAWLRGRAMVREMAVTAASGVETENAFHSLDKLVETASLRGSLAYLQIYTGSGRLLVGSKTPEAVRLGRPTDLERHERSFEGQNGSRLIELVEPILPYGPHPLEHLEESGEPVSTSKAIGIVRLALSMASLDERVSTASKRAAGLLLLALVALGGVFYALSRWLADRVTALYLVTEEIGKGHYDVVIRKKWQDEIGVLAHGIIRMAKELKMFDQDAKLLQLVTEGVARADSLDQALRVVLAEICRVTSWIYGEAWMMRRGENHLTFLTSWSKGGDGLISLERAAKGLTCARGHGLPGRAWAEKHVVWISDVLADTTFLRREAARELGLRSAAAVPLMTEDEVIGVLVFFRSAIEVEDKRLLPALSAVAGQVGGLIARKQAEQWVGALSGIMAQVADPIVLTDKKGTIEYVNPAFEELTGWKGEEVMGLTPRALKSGFQGAEFYKRLWKSILGGEVFRAEFVNVKRNGELYYYEQTISPLIDSIGAVTGFVGTGKDVTDRHRLEKDRIKTAKLESVGVLAGGIAHDFNNILTAVIGNISMAKREAAEGTDLHTSLSEAETASRRAKALTQQLLTFARGGVPVRRVLDLAPLVQSSAEFSSRGTSAKCEVRVAEDLWTVEADPGQVQQVVQNLVVNAVQSMASGGTIGVSLGNYDHPGLNHPSLGPGRYVLLEVRDTGAGIAPEHLAKVYEPYFTTKPTGSGLGLAVCHSIVKNHGGHIGIRSEVGKGTAVTVYLPATEKVSEAPTRKSLAAIRGKGRILLMDDEEAVRSVGVRMLKSLGYEVETAHEGRQAVDLYAARAGNGGAFDAVIMDLTVPGGMGGKDAVKEILKVDPSACVLVSSGYSADPILARFRDYGFKGRVPKPYGIEELSRTLSEVLKA